MSHIGLTSTENPEAHLEKLQGAIDGAIKVNAGGAAGAGPGAAAAAPDDPVVTGLAASQFGAFTHFGDALRTGVEGGKNTSSNSRRNSLFVGSGGPRAHEPVPLVPLGYGDKISALKRARKAAGKKPGSASNVSGNVFDVGRVAITHQSLTGATSTSTTAVPIKGAINLSKQALAALGVGRDLLDDLDNTKRAIENRYDSDDRLAAELEKDDPRAKQVVENQGERAGQLAKARPKLFRPKNNTASNAAKAPSPPNSTTH